MSELLALAAGGGLPVVVSMSAGLGEGAEEWGVGLRVTRSGQYLVQVREFPVRLLPVALLLTAFACGPEPQPPHRNAQSHPDKYVIYKIAPSELKPCLHKLVQRFHFESMTVHHSPRPYAETLHHNPGESPVPAFDCGPAPQPPHSNVEPGNCGRCVPPAGRVRSITCVVRITCAGAAGRARALAGRDGAGGARGWGERRGGVLHRRRFRSGYFLPQISIRHQTGY